MENKETHRGRLIDHLHLVVRDIEASRRFYTAALGSLGFKIQLNGDDYFSLDELYVSSKKQSDMNDLTGRVHLAFQAESRERVEKFHAAALEAGGRDNGKPGEREKYHPGYYGAFVLDPDGNNIEAVYHGPAKRSAPSVKLSWD